jgi:hypothetical protein
MEQISSTRRKALIITVLFTVFCLLMGCSSSAVTKVIVRERYDSLIVKYDTVRIAGKSDTVLVEKSVMDSLAVRSIAASIDTTVSGVRVITHYTFPADRWYFQLSRRDTVVRWMVRDSLIEAPYEVEKTPWWVGYVLLVLCVLLVIAFIRR